MGNSGSVHHMQSGLKELHSYYHVQTNGDDGDDLPQSYPEAKTVGQSEFVERDKPLMRSKFSRIPSRSREAAAAAEAKNTQIKVLPNLTENLRLRSTTNGAILQSGGTISGRKESVFPQPMVMERSKTFIQESVDKSRMMTRRSQSQISIELRKGPQESTGGGHYKRFSSQLDLEVEQTTSSEMGQKLSKVKIKNKKRKAPPVPPTSSAGAGKVPEMVVKEAQVVDKEVERKQRLFKTKSETVFQTSKGVVGRQPPQKVLPAVTTDNIRSSYRTSQSSAVTKAGFRREKSFDATLLSSRNKEAAVQEPLESSYTKRRSFQMPIATMPTKLAPKAERSDLKTGRSDFKTERNLQSERNDFKTELEAATKCRFIRKSTYASQQDRPSRQREPNSRKPNPSPKPETQSRIPQLKKTFYFGMEHSKRRPDDSSQKQDTQPPHDENSDDGRQKSTPEPVYALNHKSASEINDNGIQVNVRPTLPRRQLEIPRFSPVAAWRTLSEEYRKQLLESSGCPRFGFDLASTLLTEDRIYKTYREPCPFYPDNKSGDSGISGDDAYLPEKPIQPRNLIQTECDELLPIGNLERYPVDDVSQPAKVVGPFLTPWTPQQDLDEDDTSSDGDVAIKIDEAQSPTAAHVFSLSLPRENQLSMYCEKNKPDFRSLQKLKRTASGELTGSGCDCTQSSDSNLLGNACLGNYRSDNWLLSKTGLDLNAEPPSPPVASCKQIESSAKSFLDLSVSIQPLSLGSLATGKHVMYLPNRPIKELKRQSVPESSYSKVDDFADKNIRSRNKRFSFQSSVRQIERRRLAEKLSKDAEQKEALRKSELEAMRRVEEEFQRKRAYEKATIRHQLRLYSMDDENFTSLPVEYTPNCNAFRAEPDGAVSSTSDSPILSANDEVTYPSPRRTNADSSNEDHSMSIEDDKISLQNPADKRSSSIYVHRRSCIRRGGACDHRPNDCCFSSSCRCNLWGSNCRCQRMGLFQKWG